MDKDKVREILENFDEAAYLVESEHDAWFREDKLLKALYHLILAWRAEAELRWSDSPPKSARKSARKSK